MSIIEKILTTIANPREGSERIAQKPLIEDAILIIGIYAAISAIVAYIQGSKLIIHYEGIENMAQLQSTMHIAGIIGAIIGVFITWLILAGVIHLIALAMSGEAKFHPQMTTLTAYAMTPLILSALITLLLVNMIPPIELTMSATNPLAGREVMKELTNNPYMIASTIIGLAAWIWTTIILYFAIQHAHKLPSKKAAITAAIPLIIITAITILPRL